MTLVVDGDEQTSEVEQRGVFSGRSASRSDLLWLGKDQAVFLASQADRWRVDQRHDLLRVLHGHVVEQFLIAILQRGQGDVARQIVGHVAKIVHESFHLQLRCGDSWRQEAMDAVGLSFFDGERRALNVERARGLARRVAYLVGASIEQHVVTGEESSSGHVAVTVRHSAIEKQPFFCKNSKRITAANE